MKEEDYESPRSFFPIPTAFDMAGVHFISLSDLPSRDAESYGTQGSQAVSHGGGQRCIQSYVGGMSSSTFVYCFTTAWAFFSFEDSITPFTFS